MELFWLESIALKQPTNTDAKPVWIQLAKTGRFNGHASGPFEITTTTLSEIVGNFRATKNQRIAVDFEHASEQAPTDGAIPTEGAPAQGWIVDLAVRGAELWGLVEWLPKAREYIRSGQYRFFSPAVVFNSRDRVTGKNIGARMSSGALTNKPFLDGMAPLAASYATRALSGEPVSSPPMVDGVNVSDIDMLGLLLRAAGIDSRLFASAKEQAEADESFGIDKRPGLASEASSALGCDVSTAAGVEAWALTPDDAFERLARVRYLRRVFAIAKVEGYERRAMTAEADLVVLRERALEGIVELALNTYRESKGLRPENKPQLLAWAKSDPAGFDAMYPAILASKQHLLLNLTGNGGESGGNRGAGGAQHMKQSGAPKTLTFDELVQKAMTEKGMSVDQAYDFVGAQIESAKRQAAARGGY